MWMGTGNGRSSGMHALADWLQYTCTEDGSVTTLLTPSPTGVEWDPRPPKGRPTTSNNTTDKLRIPNPPPVGKAGFEAWPV